MTVDQCCCSRCFAGRALACSHDAQTRAFEGYAGSGPLMLDVDFNRNARCAVLISEPTSTGPKPITTANWDLELRVTVEGAPCRPPACAVVSGDATDATQSLYIDLTQIEDCDECKTCWMLQPVHIDIEVAPLAETGADVCVFNRVEINRRFRASPPNFRNLELGQIEVDSADFWTTGPLWSRSRSLDTF